MHNPGQPTALSRDANPPARPNPPATTRFTLCGLRDLASTKGCFWVDGRSSLPRLGQERNGDVAGANGAVWINEFYDGRPLTQGRQGSKKLHLSASHIQYLRICEPPA